MNIHERGGLTQAAAWPLAGETHTDISVVAHAPTNRFNSPCVSPLGIPRGTCPTLIKKSHQAIKTKNHRIIQALNAMKIHIFWRGALAWDCSSELGSSSPQETSKRRNGSEVNIAYIWRLSTDVTMHFVQSAELLRVDIIGNYCKPERNLALNITYAVRRDVIYTHTRHLM